MTATWQEFRFAARRLAQSPGFSAVAALTLAVGIGANTAIFSVVNAVMLRPLPYPQPDRLVTVEETDQGEPSNVGFATFADWRDQAGSFEALAAISYWEPTLSAGEGDPEAIEGSSVSAAYFDVLGVAPFLGRSFRPDEDRPEAPRVVILAHGLWQRRFGGDPSLIDKTILLNGLERTVVGILPPHFQSVLTHESKSVEVFRPLGYDATLPQACRTCRHLRVIGRLRPGVPLERAAADLGTAMRNIERQHPTDYSAAGVSLEPLHERFVGALRPALRVLWGAVGFLLLVACANVANLSLARAATRRKELALRAALGAGRGRIMRHPLAETFLLAGAGGALGVALAAWGTRAPEAQMESADGAMRLVARVAGDPLAVAETARRTLLALDPNLRVAEIASMEQLIGASVAQRRFTMLLLGLFAATALLLAAIGVYGLMSHSVTRRTGEMGIRMALGARPSDVLRLVMGQGLRVVVVGLALGLAGALALAGAMRGLLFGVQVHDPVTLLTVAAALLAVAVLACWLSARRAVRLQPVAALRSGGDD